MKVACLNKISPLGINRFKPDFQLTEDVNQADLILVRSANMLEMEIPSQLLAVARAGAGVNNIPLERMAEKGVVVFNTPGANANGVKELVLAGMLIAVRDVIGGVEWVRENKADENIAKSVEKAKAAFGGTEIIGKTIGVIGLGAVGGKVAKACVDLGMKVIGYDPYISEEARALLPMEVALEADLDEVYPLCDFISLHLPLLDSTKKMINQATMATMKPGAILLNFSRDQLVDDMALELAINAGIIRKYVTDFPNPKTANMAGVIAIPHLGASTEESEDNCAVMAVDQLVSYVELGSIRNSVNFPRLDCGPKTSRHRLLLLHKNGDSFLAKLTTALGSKTQVTNLLNNTKGHFGATAIDVDGDLCPSVMETINGLEGLIKIRMI
ncbi:MAG: 3-phosphoglycerate dehydrogenase family protein [Candidatus Izemoplasmatales bacterium]|jgi:D-3-phosphoglycerate dehydrogenase|nr:3-phosphoglycerate dehydrogenase family protein [Candidatus Izemoplasmatales bacterium]NLF48177.1 3-phosphoglycerate dehydrogenase [Acholeplasmataceae bacterium]MDD4354700.1 3-phosphoglycerate dehydrogenase family protein [Candidatus Izemoplasmatales bacterium]MDD4988196.1 3-phosphoglycerate dehydrogenase family protein [Candidatus Izemoplasmatales bacterium]MDD5601967.1 3-phosphoglycerate dehydrogenase family protein [Candidatus Izemoplasmatales bacterium]